MTVCSGRAKALASVGSDRHGWCGKCLAVNANMVKPSDDGVSEIVST